MIVKLAKSLGFGWIFLIIVVAVYAFTGIVDFQLMGNSLSAFANMFIGILPILAVVFCLIFLTNLFIKPKSIVSHVGVESGLKGWAISITGGIFSSGPMYMWYPFLAELRKRGMRNSLLAAFLYNRAIKIHLIPVMMLYFGWEFTLILTFYMIIFSVLNGVILERLV